MTIIDKSVYNASIRSRFYNRNIIANHGKILEGLANLSFNRVRVLYTGAGMNDQVLIALVIAIAVVAVAIIVTGKKKEHFRGYCGCRDCAHADKCVNFIGKGR